MITVLVTAIDGRGRFIDQKKIRAENINLAERYGFDWIERVGGNWHKSKVERI